MFPVGYIPSVLQLLSECHATRRIQQRHCHLCRWPATGHSGLDLKSWAWWPDGTSSNLLWWLSCIIGLNPWRKGHSSVAFDDKLRLTCMDDRYLTVLWPELTMAKLSLKVCSFKDGIEWMNLDCSDIWYLSWCSSSRSHESRNEGEVSERLWVRCTTVAIATVINDTMQNHTWID